MSLIHTPIMNDRLNNIDNPNHHMRSHSYTELLQEARKSVVTRHINKRSYSDDLSSTPRKRSRTAPPSPPYESFNVTCATTTNNSQSPLPELHPTRLSSFDQHNNTLAANPGSARSRSLSPGKRFVNPLSPSNSPKSSPVIISAPPPLETKAPEQEQEQEEEEKIRLPSIAAALNSAPITPRAPIKLKPITPTVSLDYFDTYKPNDENWRYELLDKITKESRAFNINQYNYLNKYATRAASTSSTVTSSATRDSSVVTTNTSATTSITSPSKPNFDSRISSKLINNKTTLLPKMNYDERKINFPYESNYTYLNQTYLNDVKMYPEYLELAQSLIQLSRRPEQSISSSPTESNIKTVETPLPTPRTINRTVPKTQQQQQLPQLSPIDFATTATTVQPHAYGEYNSYNLATSPVISSYVTQPTSYYPTPTTATSLPPISSIKTTMMTQQQQQQHKMVPLTPPSSSPSAKPKSDILKSPSSKHQQHHYHHHHHNTPRVCISCGSDQSPCWRPSWSIKEGQLCNSCGLRYKKTSARCLNSQCKKIPAKGEWALMQSKGMVQFGDGIDGYSCLECGWRVEVKK
ncbi:ASH1 [[Candida] subhashii]|uniref:ASH1 n=1 Tax=[Candida] subhashii TaxID=561895 RepID=A0A8J5R224_9ASCO|nr:ASH1 [[Candida] subhashii]KAG7664825.1 ASH1 [[Candida] subhashii]